VGVVKNSRNVMEAKMGNKAMVLSALSDLQPHSTFEIMETLFPDGKRGLFRLAAYVGFLKNDGYDIDGWFDPDDHKKYWYRLKVSEPVVAPVGSTTADYFNRLRGATVAIDLKNKKVLKSKYDLPDGLSVEIINGTLFIQKIP